MLTRDMATLDRIRKRRREMAHSSPEAIEVQGTKKLTAADAYKEQESTPPSSAHVGIDPERFGAAVGQAIYDAVEPLKKRIATLEGQGGQKTVGRSGLVFKGGFQKALDYKEGDVVTHNDRLYVAVKNIPAGDALRDGMAGWVLMVKGAQQ